MSGGFGVTKSQASEGSIERCAPRVLADQRSAVASPRKERRCHSNMAKKSLFGSIQRLGEDRYRVYWTHDGARKSKVIRGTRDDAEIFLASMRTGRIPDQPWGTYYKSVVHPTFSLLEPKTVEGY